MPAKVPTKKATTSGLTKEDQQKRQKKIDAAISTLATLLPGGIAALTAQKGGKALVKKKAAKAKNWMKDTTSLKKGGKVKKYVKGGTVRKGKSKK